MAGGGPSGPGALPPLPSRGYQFAGKAFGALMWTWIFYRAYHDGPALIVCFVGVCRPVSIFSFVCMKPFVIFIII